MLCSPHPQLLSLLLEALSCSDCVVQLSTLSCLQPLLLEAPQIMSLHVDTLVTKFLSLTSSPTMVCMLPSSPSKSFYSTPPPALNLVCSRLSALLPCAVLMHLPACLQLW